MSIISDYDSTTPIFCTAYCLCSHRALNSAGSSSTIPPLLLYSKDLAVEKEVQEKQMLQDAAKAVYIHSKVIGMQTLNFSHTCSQRCATDANWFNHVASQSKKAIKTREREAKEAARLVKEE